jgi:hypothetical protein
LAEPYCASVVVSSPSCPRIGSNAFQSPRNSAECFGLEGLLLERITHDSGSFPGGLRQIIPWGIVWDGLVKMGVNAQFGPILGKIAVDCEFGVSCQLTEFAIVQEASAASMSVDCTMGLERECPAY